MADIYSKSEQAIPRLRHFADLVLALADEIMLPGIRYDESNDFSFMCLGFMSKQVEHLRSICVLVDNLQYRDAELIARSAMEGFSLLFWVKENPSRPSLWRNFIWVEDYRLLLKQEEAGEKIQAENKVEIERQLKAHGSIYLTNRNRDKQKKGEQLPKDPYRPNWHGSTLQTICDEVDTLPLYDGIYRGTSQWTHWTPGAIGRAIRREGGKVKYSSEAQDSGARALASGFQSLFQTMELVNAQLQLGFSVNLAELADAYTMELVVGPSENRPE